MKKIKAQKPYLLNSFSANLLKVFPAQVEFVEISVDQARDLLSVGFVSVVGHANTALRFKQLLALDVRVSRRRKTVHLSPGAWAVLGQYSGPRLDEGITELPANAPFRWFRVAVVR